MIEFFASYIWLAIGFMMMFFILFSSTRFMQIRSFPGAMVTILVMMLGSRPRLRKALASSPYSILGSKPIKRGSLADKDVLDEDVVAEEAEDDQRNHEWVFHRLLGLTGVSQRQRGDLREHLLLGWAC